MRKLVVGLALILFLTAGVVCVVAAPSWYECNVKWAGAGGGGVYIVLQNTNSFPTTLGPSFPVNTIMVAGSATDPTEANRILATALAAQAGGKKVMVYTEPISFSTIGGLYSVEP